ncbi:hypothetical protein OC842_000545 [Tilletia horrida]|uniref:Pre-mRNA-splicing factor 18 n=1 Tax=Tilletia horrida TaxID=155126 RepID=A0AAN6GI23_9BASI|nr:hypothetical protein OC842_000545 [Tilletia horrida]KAK0558772.1 hypothetical protein OC844_004892 [Tilletia horrida]
MDALRAELAAAKARRASAAPADDSAPSSSSSSKYIRRKDLPQAGPTQEEEPAAKRQRVASPATGTASSSSKATGARAEAEQAEAAAKDAALVQAAKDALATAIAEDGRPGDPSSTSAAAAAATTTSSSSTAPAPAFNISPEEAIRRLRAKGQPIRLFGESDKDRRLRLRALELLEERGGGAASAGGQNDFMRALAKAGQDHRDALAKADTAGSAGAGAGAGTVGEAGGSTPKRGERDGTGTPEPGAGIGAGVGAGGEASSTSSSSKPKEGVGMDQVLDLSLLKREPNKLYPIIYHTLKGLLKDWSTALAERPEEVQRSTQGKLAAATQVQAAEYLAPLFKLLRKRALAPDVLARLSEIVHFVQKREYRYANDSYLQLSIGNAPWPIGVTMVGIHERSGREKIFSSNVAHVLNDEVSRKYIQSLKRLMTFAQTKYPPASTAMLMG